MRDKTSISVVIPLFNKERVVARTIFSILHQTRAPEEIIIVDDGSSDRSLEKVQEVLRAVDSNRCKFIVHRQKNLGVSVARNVGVDKSSSKYIAFLDADDEWLPEHLSEIEKLCLEVPNAGILSTRHARIFPAGRVAPEPSALPIGFFGVVRNSLDAYRRGYGILHTSAIAVSRAAWDRSGGFPVDERKSQDIHLWLRLLLSDTFAHSDRVTCIWHEEDSGVLRRKGSVPAHFKYFLGSDLGRKALANPELMEFIRENLLVHVAGHRLRGDDDVVAELMILARHLPFLTRVNVRVLGVLPRKVLSALGALRRNLRNLR